MWINYYYNKITGLYEVGMPHNIRERCVDWANRIIDIYPTTKLVGRYKVTSK